MIVSFVKKYTSKYFLDLLIILAYVKIKQIKIEFLLMYYRTLYFLGFQ